MMQNIFMARTADKSFLKKNIVFFTFCIYIFLIFAYSIRLHKRRKTKRQEASIINLIKKSL